MATIDEFFSHDRYAIVELDPTIRAAARPINWPE